MSRSLPPLSGLEGGHGALLGLSFDLCRRLRLGYAQIDFGRRCPAHLVRHMGVYVQRGGGGDVTQDGGESLDVHPVFQTVRCEGMPEVHLCQAQTKGIL